MNGPHDRNSAIVLLAVRERGGFSFGFALRRGARALALFLAAFAGTVAIAAVNVVVQPSILAWSAFSCILGFGAGVIVREIAALRLLQKNWAFREAIIDWAKVERIASGQE
ncbi:MAG TPA: hypothetical protein VGM05_19320 [Planctomycetaceae bacterium]|jgi:hypothetical protein